MFSFQGASCLILSASPTHFRVRRSASFSTIELLIAKKLNETPNRFEISVNFLTFNFPLSTFNLNGGGEYRDRTGDLLLARQALSQLS